MNFWILGFILGFSLIPKVLPFLKKHKVYIFPLPIIGAIGIGFGLGLSNSCTIIPSSSEDFSLKPVVEKEVPIPSEVSEILTNTTVPSREFLGELSQLRKHEDTERSHQAVVNAINKFWSDESSTTGFARLKEYDFMRQSDRKGPFCHVTCNVHHRETYDVETIPEVCKENYIPPSDSKQVPGWSPWKGTNGDVYDVLASYCGPGTTKKGAECSGKGNSFENYKIYWQQ